MDTDHIALSAQKQTDEAGWHDWTEMAKDDLLYDVESETFRTPKDHFLPLLRNDMQTFINPFYPDGNYIFRLAYKAAGSGETWLYSVSTDPEFIKD